MSKRYPIYRFDQGSMVTQCRIEAETRGGAVANFLRILRRNNPGEQFQVGTSGFTILWTPHLDSTWAVMDHDYKQDGELVSANKSAWLAQWGVSHDIA